MATEKSAQYVIASDIEAGKSSYNYIYGYETVDEAVSAAQVKTEENSKDTLVFKAVKRVKYPVPEYDVEEIA